MWMNDGDFWKMCALLGIVCASIGAFTYVMAGVMGRMPFYGVAETGPATNYGADISTLVKEIEAGRL